MTTSHLILMTSLYLAVFVGVAYLTRAKVPRIAGALCGGAVCGLVALLAIALVETHGWRVPKVGSLYFRLLLWLGVAVSCTPVYLITWRVARRFGRAGNVRQ
jgi:Kef-type K+ transport system membrane component KefB